MPEKDSTSNTLPDEGSPSVSVEKTIIQESLDQSEVEILNDIPNEEVKKNVIKLIVRAKESRTTVYNSPIPIPSDLSEYKEISPDLVNRLFVMAEEAQRHQMEKEMRVIALEEKSANNDHSMVKDHLDADISYNKRGQFLAFIFVVLSLGLGFTAIMFNHEIGGGILSAIGVATIATSFITSRMRKQ